MDHLFETIVIHARDKKIRRVGRERCNEFSDETYILYDGETFNDLIDLFEEHGYSDSKIVVELICLFIDMVSGADDFIIRTETAIALYSFSVIEFVNENKELFKWLPWE